MVIKRMKVIKRVMGYEKNPSFLESVSSLSPANYQLRTGWWSQKVLSSGDHEISDVTMDSPANEAGKKFHDYNSQLRDGYPNIPRDE